jgi:hypothetical protein
MWYYPQSRAPAQFLIGSLGCGLAVIIINDMPFHLEKYNRRMSSIGGIFCLNTLTTMVGDVLGNNNIYNCIMGTAVGTVVLTECLNEFNVTPNKRTIALTTFSATALSVMSYIFLWKNK